MGELIQFPVERRRLEIENIQMEGPPISMDNCTDLIHVFDEVPGRCKCGQNEWTPDHTVEPDGIGVFDPPPAS